MRILPIALFLAASVAGAQKSAPPAKPAPEAKRADANAPTPGVPKMPGPRLKLIEGPVIDGKKEQLEGDLTVYPGPNGQTVVRTSWSLLSAYDSTGRRLWMLDRGRNAEIADVTALGWRGTEVWVSDTRFDQIAIIDKGTVTKSLELPSWVRPTFSNRKSFPVFGSMEVYALLADGSMMVVPTRAHSVVGTVGFDSTAIYLLHVKEDGIIDRTIAKIPSRDYAVRAEYAKLPPGQPFRGIQSSWRFGNNYWPRFRVSPDGMRTVTVSVDTSGTTTDTVIVAAVDEKGAPVFTTKFGFPRVAYTEKQIDSLAMHQYGHSSPTYRAQKAKAMPRSLPTVFDVTLGRDYSVWITLRDANDARPIVGIDAAGRFIGTTYVPRTFTLRAADRNALWICDYRPIRRDVVRYSYVKQ